MEAELCCELRRQRVALRARVVVERCGRHARQLQLERRLVGAAVAGAWRRRVVLTRHRHGLRRERRRAAVVARCAERHLDHLARAAGPSPEQERRRRLGLAGAPDRADGRLVGDERHQRERRGDVGRRRHRNVGDRNDGVGARRRRTGRRQVRVAHPRERRGRAQAGRVAHEALAVVTVGVQDACRPRASVAGAAQLPREVRVIGVQDVHGVRCGGRQAARDRHHDRARRRHGVVRRRGRCGRVGGVGACGNLGGGRRRRRRRQNDNGDRTTRSARRVGDLEVKAHAGSDARDAGPAGIDGGRRCRRSARECDDGDSERRHRGAPPGPTAPARRAPNHCDSATRVHR
mmetsp:Transcript_22775/g.79575  ORF Transcript_22775/g.79575 Transcript_22775/m.79575 type:complete len:347 (+) Transcript_22775:1128-2168(+)